MANPIPAARLLMFAQDLLERAGLPADKAAVVATVLLEGDLLGHTTHGLALLPAYLGELERGTMATAGSAEVLADFPAALTWDGRKLPGPWLVTEALNVAIDRARNVGTCSVAIRRSHHTACLAAYLPRVAEAGFAALVTCSDPGIRSVAPAGGRAPVFTPNPIAAGWPTGGAPVIFDVSMSIATNGLTNRLRAAGERFPGDWAVTAAGEPTDDPNALFTSPPGALLPVGGTDHGHKGYALALLVEMLTSGLVGHGRADPIDGWSASVFVQVWNPALFGGREAFERQTGWLADACRAIPPIPGGAAVRLPGEAGLARRARQLAEGVELHAGILEALAPWAAKLGAVTPG